VKYYMCRVGGGWLFVGMCERFLNILEFCGVCSIFVNRVFEDNSISVMSVRHFAWHL